MVTRSTKTPLTGVRGIGKERALACGTVPEGAHQFGDCRSSQNSAGIAARCAQVQDAQDARTSAHAPSYEHVSANGVGLQP